MADSKKRILIADPSPELHSDIALSEFAKDYEILSVDNGPDCLKQIFHFKPHLVVLDLLLPRMHSIEILKKLKQQDIPPMGIIIMTYELMMQNYQAAIDWGADYFLNKPFTVEHFFSLVESYFHSDLKAEPFKGIPPIKENPFTIPSLSEKTGPYIKFWGTRGSIAISGHNHIRYGGHTSCLEISYGDDLVIIDAGTGITALGGNLDLSKYKNINIFISHTHLDHIIGFPFFDPLYVPGVQTNLWAPVSFEKDTKELFTDMLAYAFFPVKLEEMKGNIEFHDLRDGSSIEIGSIRIDCCYTYHPGPTLGFKIHVNGKKIGYITDNEILIGYMGRPEEITPTHEKMQPHLELLEFLQDIDILVHEAQYFDGEYKAKVGWGHSSISNATALALLLNVQEWYVTHHDPKHTDEDLYVKFEMHKNLLKECGSTCQLSHARDGLILPI